MATLVSAHTRCPSTIALHEAITWLLMAVSYSSLQSSFFTFDLEDSLIQSPHSRKWIITATAFRDMLGTPICSEYLGLTAADRRRISYTAHTDRHHPIGRYHKWEALRAKGICLLRVRRTIECGWTTRCSLFPTKNRRSKIWLEGPL